MLLKNIFLLLIFSFINLSGQSHANDILGNWVATDRSVIVQVQLVNNQYRAKLLWFDERLGSGKPMNERRDVANPDPKLRGRKIVGMEILQGLIYDPQKQTWEHGKIYDGSTGRTWDSSASFTSDGLLKVRGYWKFKWIGKTMQFRRTNANKL